MGCMAMQTVRGLDGPISVQEVTFVKSWTLEAPGWTVTGPHIFFFPAIPLNIYIPPKAIISDFYS